MIDNIVWCEKYRPKTIDEVILPTSLKKKVKSLIKNDNIPNMIFHSTSPGTGKTSLALAICNELGYDVLMINGSNEGQLIGYKEKSLLGEEIINVVIDVGKIFN
jgi:replication-associated recombination protein RarA